MGRHRRPLAGLLVLIAVAATGACTSSETGNPTTAAAQPSEASESTGPPVTTTTTGSGIVNPIDLHGVNPCTLFGGGVGTKAHTAAATPTKLNLAALPASTACIEADGHANLALTLAVANVGLADFTDAVPGTPKQTTVSGYPAVVVASAVDKSLCVGGVGVGEDQLLYLMYGTANPASSPTTGQQALCQAIPGIAESVIAQLAQR